MEAISSFFIPTIGTGIVSALLTILNVIIIIASGALMTFTIYYRKRKKNSPIYKRKLYPYIIISAVTVVLFCVLSIYAPNASPYETSKILSGLAFLLKILNPFFSLKSVIGTPSPHFPGINILVRILMLCGGFVLVKLLCRAIRICTKRFFEFLNEKFFTNKKPTLTEKQKAARRHQAYKMVSVVAPNASGTIVFLTYVFGSAETKSTIETILELLRAILDAITLTDKVVPAPSDPLALLSNFFYVILSICILAVYVAMIIALFTFITSTAKYLKKNQIWETSKINVIFLIAGVLIVISLACMIIFFAGTEFDSFHNFIDKIFDLGPSSMFETAAKFVLLVLSICIALFMLCFLIVFAFFIVHSGYKTVMAIILQKDPSDRHLKLSKKAILIAAITAPVLLLMFEYEKIREILLTLFPTASIHNATPLWIISRCILLIAVMLTAIIVMVSAFMLFRFLLSKLIRNISANDTSFFKLLQSITNTLTNTIRKLLSTLISIFNGYDTESKKNRALFTAACFASLASLLNTYFGLIDFYSDDESFIPKICSFAISCAVQLAMLIFGMKAGESIAENIISHNNVTARGYARVIVSKIFRCIFYLLIYATAAGVTAFYFFASHEKSLDLRTLLPIIFFLLSTIIFIYALVMQIIDIRALKEAKKKLESESTAILPSVIKNPKRLPTAFYFVSYCLLMIVSTGFAFNNLFGYYADKAALHEQIYDQVRYETDSALKLNSKINTLINEYNTNKNDIISEIETRASEAVKKREADIKELEEKKEAAQTQEENLRYLAANNLDNYIGDIKNFDVVTTALKSYINTDYADIGDDVTITITTYEHYWMNNPQPSHTSSSLAIKLSPHDDEIHIGDKLEVSEHDTLPGRYEAPNGEDFSVAITDRIITGADKYDIIDELLSQFESMENTILEYGKDGDGKSDNENESEMINGIDIRELLNRNDIIDGVRNNIGVLCKNTRISIVDISRVVNKYLSKKGSEAADGKKTDNYENLHEYIDRALSINNILSAAIKTNDDTAANDVRAYRNYAKGITNSNFQISYDALLRGTGGLNNSKENINALYRANIVAVFLLVICLLIDFMAFFSGLLLFKDVFLFEQNKKLSTIGYLNYDSALTNFFHIPKGKLERKLHLAFIYYLQNCDAFKHPSSYIPPQGSTDEIYKTLRSQAFFDTYDAYMKVLQELGIEKDSSMANLQIWLKSFVDENEISLDDTI